MHDGRRAASEVVGIAMRVFIAPKSKANVYDAKQLQKAMTIYLPYSFRKNEDHGDRASIRSDKDPSPQSPRATSGRCHREQRPGNAGPTQNGSSAALAALGARRPAWNRTTPDTAYLANKNTESLRVKPVSRPSC